MECPEITTTVGIVNVLEQKLVAELDVEDEIALSHMFPISFQPSYTRS